MARTLPLTLQTAFADLAQRALDAEFDERYDERGNFLRRRRGGLLYWHYVRDIDGKKREEYVGPVRDAAINERVKRFDEIKSDFRERRKIVRALVQAGLPAPNALTGGVVEALWKAGFFRLRGVLVGTAAYQCYSGLLGISLPGQILMTGDVDVAQFYDVSHFVRDTIPPILEVLREVDPSFRPVTGINHPTRAARFVSDSRFLVEFLTPNRGANANAGKLSAMPALGGASATPLRFLDFLIHEPTRSVVLHKGGVPVIVPTPERYAVHKLIVAVERRENLEKRAKDIRQAEELFRALMAAKSFHLAEVWEEAWERGPRWRQCIEHGAGMMDETVRTPLLAALEAHGWRASPRAKPAKQAKAKKKSLPGKR